MSKLLTQLQNSEEGTKQWIVVGASVLTGVVVIWLWLAYFNTIVQPQVAAASSNNGAGLSFLTTLRGGLALAGDALSGFVHWLGHLVLAPRSVSIQPSS